MLHTRLSILSGQYTVFASRAPMAGDIDALLRPGSVSVCLTHDTDMHWPDRRGESLLRAVLKSGGTAALVFASLNDAMRCQQRLTREVMQ